MAILINTRVTDRDLRGMSHWWGAPDMPEGMAYPCIDVEDEDGGTSDTVLGYCGAGSGGLVAAPGNALFLRSDRLFSWG